MEEIGNLREFSIFLLEISVRFIQLAPEQVDSEIHDGLSRVCEFLGLQRSSVWQGSRQTPDTWRLTHLYQHPDYAAVILKPDGEIVPRGGWTLFRPEVPPSRTLMDAREYFPWISDRCLDRRIVVLNSLDDLPPEAEIDRRSLAQFGSQSCLVFPLIAGDSISGILSFAVIGRQRAWTQDIVDKLHLMSQVFAHALTRKIDDLALRESEERLSLAATAAGITLWSIEYGSQRMWANESGRIRLGLPAGELTLTRFLALVHPEDRARVEETYRASPDRAEIEVEYRLMRPDSGCRWIVTRGRARMDSDGRPQRLMGVTLDITERKEMENRLQESLIEVRRLKSQLEAEVVSLRERVAACQASGEILGTSDAIRYVNFRISQVAPLDATVLILGETGTGKNLAAAAIHAQSARGDRPLVTVSCAALPGNLIENELFGRERGAFTSADQARMGRFEAADGATIFLDEIGDLPMELQAKLLRVVQTGELERLGSSKTIKVDARIIAATNWDLGQAVREGRFRADLFYRLNVFPLTMPSLRSRKEDIPLLTRAHMAKCASRFKKPISGISQGMLATLQNYDWPGNVRELENVIERAVILSTGPTLHLAEPLCDLTENNALASRPEDTGTTLEALEAGHIRRILQAVGWRIEGSRGAAVLLGLNPSTLRARMRKLGIRRSTDSRG
jgi:formate hydrogenlyase transcriptional activator